MKLPYAAGIRTKSGRASTASRDDEYSRAGRQARGYPCANEMNWCRAGRYLFARNRRGSATSTQFRNSRGRRIDPGQGAALGHENGTKLLACGAGALSRSPTRNIGSAEAGDARARVDEGSSRARSPRAGIGRARR
jgi:hypothetical protein